MTLDITKHFRDLGSYIKVHNAVVRARDEQKQDLVFSVEQLDSDYERVSILPPYIQNVVAGVNSINSTEQNVQTAFGQYHTEILTNELPSEATTVSGVITDLFSAMNGYAPPQTFLEDGYFHTYYLEKYSRLDVPTAASGVNTVNDGWAK